MVSRGSTWKLAAGCLVVGLLVAGACSDGGGSGVATLAEPTPPPVAETTAAREPAPPAEQPPAEPAPPAEPPAASPQPAEAATAPAPPPPEQSPAPSPEGELDAAAVAELVASVEAAQAGVVSVREQLYLSLQLRLGGQPMGSIDDVPYVLSTTVGDLTHIQIDQSALAALDAFEDGTGPADPAELPPIEAVLDAGTQEIYVKLAPLAAPGLVEQPSFLDDLTAGGQDIADLWTRSGFEGAGGEILPGFDLGARAVLAEFLGLLKAASDTGSVLEARSVGAGEVAGVATQEYAFQIDLAAVVGQWPPFLESLIGGPGGGEAPPLEFLDSLPSPLATGFSLHVDGDGVARQAGFDLDLGEILMAVFAAFGEMGDAPEGADVDFPEMEYRIAVRIEVLAVNDPSLGVSLPDPSQVVDLPSLFGADG